MIRLYKVIVVCGIGDFGENFPLNLESDTKQPIKDWNKCRMRISVCAACISYLLI